MIYIQDLLIINLLVSLLYLFKNENSFSDMLTLKKMYSLSVE